MEILAREKLLREFSSPSFADLPPGAFPPHRLYVADRFNFFTIAYNTNLVKPEDVPNTYQDLLLPRWAGKIGIEASDSDWFAALVKSMGEKEGMAYFQQAGAKRRPQIRTGHTLIVGTGRRRRDPAGRRRLQPRGRAPGPGRRADQVEGAGADHGAARRDRPGAQRAASARGAAVRRLHAVARRPGGDQAAQPRAVEHCRQQHARTNSRSR